MNEIHSLRKREDEFITQELRKNGFQVNSLFDLINYKQTRCDYIPILLDIIKSGKVSDDIIKDGIVRALTVKQAKGKVEDDLLHEYQELNKKKMNTLGWTIGNLFEYIYSGEYFERIKQIVKEKKNGISRQMFVLAIGKTRRYKSESENLLIELTFDEEVVLHAISSLGKLKSLKAKERIIELASYKNKSISKEAHKALEKITTE